MPKLFIIAREKETARKLQSELSGEGYSCAVPVDKDKVLQQVVDESPDLIMVEMNGNPSHALVRQLSQDNKLKKHTPIMALLSGEMLDRPDEYLAIDDFVVHPFDARELALRAKRLLQKSGADQSEVIRCGKLVIDLANCEVLVDGKMVELTYKEYELLKFLAKSRGRVFTREALLNKVWGYDYYGGDRTVDVHIRRLRSKIEYAGHTFIETVRNIGYRFTKNG